MNKVYKFLNFLALSMPVCYSFFGGEHACQMAEYVLTNSLTTIIVCIPHKAVLVSFPPFEVCQYRLHSNVGGDIYGCRPAGLRARN